MRARADRLGYEFFGVIHGKYEHVRIRQLIGDPSGGLEAVQRWHTQIQDDQIRFETTGQLDCFASVARLRHHFPASIELKQGTYAMTDDRMVVGNEYGNGLHAAFVSTGMIPRNTVPFAPECSLSSPPSCCRRSRMLASPIPTVSAGCE